MGFTQNRFGKKEHQYYLFIYHYLVLNSEPQSCFTTIGFILYTLLRYVYQALSRS